MATGFAAVSLFCFLLSFFFLVGSGCSVCFLGRNVISDHRKSMLWGMALVSQSQISSLTSGHEECTFRVSLG